MATAVEIALGEYLNTKELIIRGEQTFVGSGDENKVFSTSDGGIIENFINTKAKEKYSTNGKNILNTHALPYSFTLSAKNADNTTFPEVGLMFIKTYIKQLLPYNRIKSEDLYKVFNRNQELIELPYPVVLYLGGLNYFLEKEPNTKNIIDNKNVFEVMNNVTTTEKFTGIKSDVYSSPSLNKIPLSYLTDVSVSISQAGTTRVVSEKIYVPSLKVLNRSLYDLHSGNTNTFEETYTIKSAKDGKTENVSIPVKTIMPSVGFGIQNEFLNQYNKIMFGDYLNGTKNTPGNGNPHSVIGAFCGISKPIKTYKSNELEFTAFYRNLHVGSYNYNIDTLVTELNNITKSIKSTYTGTNPFGSKTTVETIKTDKFIRIENNVAVRDATYVENRYNNLEKPVDPADNFVDLEKFPMNSVIKAFVIYSKLKANFLSGTTSTKDDLSAAIKKLCGVKNIVSTFNADKKAKGEHEVSDFYFLVAHVFFASYKRLDKNYKTPNGRNYYDLHARLNFGMGYAEGASFGYRAYQRNCLSDGLDRILNQVNLNNVTDEINALTNFLSYVWGLEKINLKPDFNKIGGGNDVKSVYALYPSCGGAITPMSLYYPTDPNNRSDAKQRKLGIIGVNYVENSYNEGNTAANDNALHNYLYKKGNNTRDYLKVSYKESNFPIMTPKKPNIGADIEIPIFSVGGGTGYGDGPRKTITDFNNYGSDSVKFKELLDANNLGKDNSPFSWGDNPLITQYFVDPTYDRVNFLTNYAFDNKTVLKNTTRFFWFDPTSYGLDLKQEYKVDVKLDPIELAENGVTGIDLMINTFGDKDYFSLNLTNTYTYGNYEKLKEKLLLEQYTISNLMDSLDFEKLSEFTKLFLDFCKLNGKPDMILNNTNHTLRSLMLSSSNVIYEDIVDLNYNNNTWTKEEINLMLIGNSMFQYEFLSESGISTILNHSLSTAQYKNFNNIADEFCSSLITIANFSPITPISFDSKSQASLHKVIGLPEILFSNRTNYDEILALLGKSTDDDKNKTDKYFTRKILFGEQYIEPFTELTARELTQLSDLNDKYLLNKLYTHNNFDGDLNDLYKRTVTNFFRTLNIKYTEARYKQLHRLIRTYVYRIFKNNQILNDKSLPGQQMYPDVSFEEFKKQYNIG
jgi:hypothetical protein